MNPAILHTFSTSFIVAFSFPNLILLIIESENRNESCETTPICFLRHSKSYSLIELLSNKISPASML